MMVFLIVWWSKSLGIDLWYGKIWRWFSKLSYTSWWMSNYLSHCVCHRFIYTRKRRNL